MNIQQENEKALDGVVSVSDFIMGQRACKDGKPHQSKSESYNRGYAFQYELEQALSHTGVN